MHPEAYEDARRFRDVYLSDVPLAIAEIGSRDVNGSIRDLFARPNWSYTGYDIEAGPGVDVVLKRPNSLAEIADDSVPVLLCTGTLEHVRLPWLLMVQARYCLRMGGLLYVYTHAEHPYHAHPRDHYRFYPDGLASLFDYACLETVEVYTVVNRSLTPHGLDTVGIARKVRL